MQPSKRILITGVNSFIGNSFYDWLNQWKNEYEVDFISLKDEEWQETSFSKYDVIVHVAGIAHISSDAKLKDEYFLVNRDLAIDVAKKSKTDGVKQFIFLSSINVYGGTNAVDSMRVINRETIPTPANYYGESKLQAEEGITMLSSESFKIVILRPPMIYGKNAKGNYPILSKYARLFSFVPDLHNQRSMLYISNLCEFIRLIIKNEERGLFFPQNSEYVNTAEMVKMIAVTHGRKMVLTKAFNPILKLLSKRLPIINKAFGNLVYDKEISNYKEDYCVRNLYQSIRETEL